MKRLDNITSCKSINEYINIVNKEINKEINKEEEIKNMEATSSNYIYKHLYPFESRLCFVKGFENYELSSQCISTMKQLLLSTTSGYNLINYDNICNYSICMFPVKKWLTLFLKKRKNIIYTPQHQNDNYHFFFLIDPEKNVYKIDRYLFGFCEQLQTIYINYACKLYKKIYYNIFNHNQYNDKCIEMINKSRVQQDITTLLENIEWMLHTKKVHDTVIAIAKKYCKYTPKPTDILRKGVVIRRKEFYDESRYMVSISLWDKIPKYIMNKIKKNKSMKRLTNI